MERRLKERLTGAAILVMLAVIFIPMILDDTARNDPRITETNIPPRPEGEFSSRVVPIEDTESEQQPGSQTPEAPPPVQTGERQTGKDLSPDHREPSTVVTVPPAGEETKAQAGSTAKQPPAKEAAEQGEEEEEKDRTAMAGDANQTPADQGNWGLTAWVVQLGSFSSRENADRLIKKLRESGYAAFMETSRQDSSPVYRVRIGPELQRSDADALRDKLNRELEMNGIVLQYP